MSFGFNKICDLEMSYAILSTQELFMHILFDWELIPI